MVDWGYWSAQGKVLLNHKSQATFSHALGVIQTNGVT